MALQAGGAGTKKIYHFFFALILCLAVSNTKANTSKTNGTCGGTLTGTSGTFSSPDFIAGRCTWTIFTDIDKIVRIAFNTFNISCYMDYIEVWDGNGSSSLLLDRFCHMNPEGELRSTGNTLVVHHMTYDSTWNSGFSAVWSAVDVNKDCGGALSNHITQGTLVSPCYLNDTCTNDNWMVCVWTITVSNGNRIYLHFNDIQLEWSDGCYKEYVAVWDGTSDRYRRFCENSYDNFHSNQNSMTVVFSSNGNMTSKGFSAYWNTVCGTSISWDYNKTIESPGYPDEYYGGQNCRYYFSGNSYSTSRVIFTYFHLPNTSCDTDYIEVYSNSYHQQRYCHNSPPPNLTDIYELRFVSSSSASAGYGFQARVSRELNCGDTEIRLQENVEYHLYYSHHEHLEGKCEWTATAEKGLAIMMIGHFSCYDSDCINRFIKIYNETSKDQSSLITPRYSRHGEIFVDEAANTMLVEYVTNSSYYFYMSVTFMAYNATQQNFTCGSTNASAKEGNITFTSYASPSINGYYKNGICTWTIEAKEDEVIQLVFRGFHIESNLPGCNESAQSYLEIFDESQTEDNLLLKFVFKLSTKI